MALFAARHLHRKFSLASSELSSTIQQPEVEVIAIPCATSASDLLTDMIALDACTGSYGLLPKVLSTEHIHWTPTTFSNTLIPPSPTDSNTVGVSLQQANVSPVHVYKMPKRRFGRPYQEHCSIYNQLHNETGIAFDLLYAPRAFELLSYYLVPDNMLVSTLLATDIPLQKEDDGGAVDVYSKHIIYNPTEFMSDCSDADCEEVEEVQLLYYHCGGSEGDESMLERYMAKGWPDDND